MMVDTQLQMPNEEEESELLEERPAVEDLVDDPNINTNTDTNTLEPTPINERKRLGTTNITTEHMDISTRSPSPPPTPASHAQNPSLYHFRIIDLLNVSPHQLPRAHLLLDSVEGYIAEHMTGHTLPARTPSPYTLSSSHTTPLTSPGSLNPQTPRAGSLLGDPPARPTTPRLPLVQTKRSYTYKKHNSTKQR